MKVVLLSDIRGNLPALELLMKSEKDSNMFIILGDVINYGHWNNKCTIIRYKKI